MRPAPLLRRLARAGARLLKDQRGSNAVEFSLLAIPFIMLLLFVFQIALYNITKMSLDTGVVRLAEDLQNRFSTNAAPSLPAGSALRTSVASYSGNFIRSDSALKLEVQPLVNLSTGAVAITDGVTNYGTANTVLALRASYTFSSFVPGFSNALMVSSSALVRRKAQ